jgi:predicted O-methyltransferase YrrM
MKEYIKARTMYRGASETARVRSELEVSAHPGWPYCPPDEGDLLCHLASEIPGQDALQVGLATGSTAAYILAGLGSGKLTSIDYDQDNHERAGEKLMARMGLSHRHELIEANSILALPKLYEAGKRFGLVFLDGWKTFDHVWVDTFYCARMLTRNGYIVFDDARMPAVRKCISLLVRYYGFQKLTTYNHVGGWRQRVWHLLSTRSTLPPYVALRKTVEIEESVAGRQFDFWARF